MAADALYGDTTSGKSKAIEMLAGYLYEQTGKLTEVYIGDGGGQTYNSRGLVDDGVIRLFDYSVLDYPDTVIKLMAEGWWPNDKGKLVPPDANHFDKYALRVYEGGTVMGGWLLSDVPGGMGWHAATKTGFGGVKDDDGLLSWKDAFKGAEKLADDYLLQGINAPKHYQIIQRKLLNAIRKSKVFPGLVIWTFHPTEGPDKTAGGESGQYGKITGRRIIGPDVGGKALASTIGKEFGNLLHMDQAITQAREKDETTSKNVTSTEREYRLYTKRHYDPNQDVLIEYVAGSRVNVEDYYTSAKPGDSLLQFYQAVSEAQKKGRAERVAVK